MNDVLEYATLHEGKQVMISTTNGRFGGILSGSKLDNEGKVVALIVQQYLHRTEVPADEILNIRLV